MQKFDQTLICVLQFPWEDGRGVGRHDGGGGAGCSVVRPVEVGSLERGRRRVARRLQEGGGRVEGGAGGQGRRAPGHVADGWQESDFGPVPWEHTAPVADIG